jgi:hypothetical protein
VFAIYRKLVNQTELTCIMSAQSISQDQSAKLREMNDNIGTLGVVNRVGAGSRAVTPVASRVKVGSGLVGWDGDCVLPAHGLHNTGVICYFNSLLQLLGGLPSVVDYTLKYSGDNKWLRLLRELFTFWKATPAASQPVLNNLPLFNELCAMLSSKNISISHTQEDAGEMFLLLLDCIGDDYLSSLFRGRYQCDMVCRKCRTKKKMAPVEWLINFAHPSEVLANHLRSQFNNPDSGSALNLFLKNNFSTMPRDMVCTHPVGDTACGGSDIIKTQRLSMTPTVILVAFTRLPGDTHNSNPGSYPHELCFSNAHMGSKYIYRWAGTVNHFGTHASGHYTYRGPRRAANHSATGEGVVTLEINDHMVSTPTQGSDHRNANNSGAYLVAYHFIETTKYW